MYISVMFYFSLPLLVLHALLAYMCGLFVCLFIYHFLYLSFL